MWRILVWIIHKNTACFCVGFKCLHFMDVQNEVDKCLKKTQTNWSVSVVALWQYLTSPVWGWISELIKALRCTPRFANMVRLIYNLRVLTLGSERWVCACITIIKKKWERSQCLGIAGCMYSCILYDQNCRSGFVTERAHLWCSCCFRSG